MYRPNQQREGFPKPLGNTTIVLSVRHEIGMFELALGLSSCVNHYARWEFAKFKKFRDAHLPEQTVAQAMNVLSDVYPNYYFGLIESDGTWDRLGWLHDSVRQG